MAIVNDYRCSGCRTVQERWTPSPAPRELACSACGAPARRLFAAVGLSGAGAAAKPVDAAPTPGGSSLCRQFPQIPGLCHMSESAGRMMVARFQRDTRRVERELARQEAAAAVRAPSIEDAITHHHHPTATAAVAAAV